MPSCPKCTAHTPHPPAWTPTMAQAALAVVAWELQEAVELLEGIHRHLPPPADLADRQEGPVALRRGDRPAGDHRMRRGR